MVIRNDRLGGTDFEYEYAGLSYSDIYDTLSATSIAEVPIGTIVAYMSHFTELPSLDDSWVECNGQTLSDADSPYNGLTIPDLNGGNRYLRGNTSSGTTGGASSFNWSHTHTVQAGTEPIYYSDNDSLANAGGTVNLTPSYFEVTWIIKVKLG